MPVTISKKGKSIPIFQTQEGGVPGASVIYAPKGQALEYSPLATNPYRGCGHACVYCYVPRISKQDRKEFDAGAIARKDFLKKLKADAIKYQAAGIKEQVMFSFMTDVYSGKILGENITRQCIEILREHGLGFCVLTKGGSRAVADIDLYRPNKDAFASTITSMDDEFAAKWERDAAPSSDRIAALKKFHDAGIFTWVSLEPTLSAEASMGVMDEAYPFVDLWKIGKLNYLPMQSQKVDWEAYTLAMIEKVEKLGAKAYFKKDLQPYLPPNYPNPLRIKQHHG